MNIKTLARVAFVAAAALAMTACSDDNDDKNVTIVTDLSKNVMFGADEVWSGVKSDQNFVNNNISFSHGYLGYPFGFTPARIATSQYYPDAMIDHQFEVVPASGKEGQAYLVANWDAYQESQEDGYHSCSITLTDEAAGYDDGYFTAEKVWITNTSFAYYTMLYGNAFARKFAEGDKLIVTAHGVGADGEHTLEFNLANCTGPEENWFVTDWHEWNLIGLGRVKEIYFTMSSTDSGAWGMNTPAYFAIDGLRLSVHKK